MSFSLLSTISLTHNPSGQSKVAAVLLARYAAKTFGPQGLRAFSVDVSHYPWGNIVLEADPR